MSSNSTIHCNSSSSHLLQTYDVFVSFRGEDTRNNFTSFLFDALARKGIHAFKDNTHLKKGESIAPELLHAIEGSRIFVVVFSKNYASSTWCLRELAHICNCIETSGRHVLPIFYDVDPSDVRKQREYYQKAFSEHEERFREDNEMMEEIQRWREALTRVANHSGWDIRNKLCNGSRTLIILDNVDQVEQLKMFTGSRENLLREYLGGGSRIIIISRDEHILRKHGVDDVYQVQPLNYEDAIRLLYRNAFKSNYVMSGYEEYTNIILSYVQGHPLAIEVLGSSLFGRSVSQWRSALTRLRENKSKNIMNVLRISFDQLDNIEKEIFLDIACFFNYYEVKYVKEILEFRGFCAEYGLQVLIHKSLIKLIKLIKCNSTWIKMNNLLIDMGRYIVQEKSPQEPRKWSRLWDYKDFHKVISDNMATENLEAIEVWKKKSDFHETTIRADALSKMTNLQLLKLKGVKFCGNLNHLSNDLGYLTWDDYPFYYLPLSFQADKLAELSLVGSNIKQLWNDTKPLHNLRRLNLSRSKNLLEMPNLCKAVNLEQLNLLGCTKLCRIDPSIGFLTKLTVLNLKNCTSLTMLPCFGETISLEKLNLEGCTKLTRIDPSIGLLKRLTFLNLKDCRNLVSLPDGILGLKNLEYLSISGCSKLYNIKLLDETRDDLLKKICEGKAPANSQSAFSLVLKWRLNLLHSRAHKDISTFFIVFLIWLLMYA